MATIDVAMESSVQAVKTVADNIYSKVDTEMASAVSNTATNNTANKTGTLSQKLAYIAAELDNSTYGLNKILSAAQSAAFAGITAITNIKVKCTYNSTVTVCDVTGKGEMELCLYTEVGDPISDFLSVTMVVDGVTLTTNGNYFPFVEHLNTSSISSATLPIKFDKSLKITVKNSKTYDVNMYARGVIKYY